MVTYTKVDLDFILKQISIPEAQPAGVPLYGPSGLIPTHDLAWDLRTVSGEQNNLLHSGHGVVDDEQSSRSVFHDESPLFDDEEDTEWQDDGIDDDDASALDGPFLGASAADILLGTSGGDLVFGFAGTDYIISNASLDLMGLGWGDDVIDAEPDQDIIFVDDDDDDLMDAGDNDDATFGGPGGDPFVASLHDGNDTYHGGEFSGDADSDTLDMTFLIVDAVVDLGMSADALYGLENSTFGTGNDADVMRGTVDVVDGGAGEDIFVFTSYDAFPGDTIQSLEAGDKIDLSGIDANAGTAVNNIFTLESGQSAAPGQIAVIHETSEGGGQTSVSDNTTGDTAPDLHINIAGNHNPTDTDFKL